jgi:hypothetical protein
MALNSAMQVCARVQIPVCAEPPLVFSHELVAGCVLGFWCLLLYKLHMYSSMWSEAEALSEYGVVHHVHQQTQPFAQFTLQKPTLVALLAPSCNFSFTTVLWYRSHFSQSEGRCLGFACLQHLCMCQHCMHVMHKQSPALP